MTRHQRLLSVLPPDRHADADLERLQHCRDAVADGEAAACATDGVSDVA